MERERQKRIAGDVNKTVVENFKNRLFFEIRFITVKQTFLNILFTHYILFI